MTDFGIQFKVDTKGLERAFIKAPGSSYFWLRFALFNTLKEHRSRWLLANGVKFGTKARGVRVLQINATVGGDKDFRTVFYSLAPLQKRRADGPLGLLHAQAFTSSTALSAFEEGATIRPTGGRIRLAIPIRPKTGRAFRVPPHRFRNRLPKSSTLIARRAKGGAEILYERQRKRTGTRFRSELTKKGKVKKRQRKTLVDVMIPRYVLVPEVKLPPLLRFYETWDGLRSFRDEEFSRAADRILKDLARGVLT